jgi:hypothetical protein
LQAGTKVSGDQKRERRYAALMAHYQIFSQRSITESEYCPARRQLAQDGEA